MSQTVTGHTPNFVTDDQFFFQQQAVEHKKHAPSVQHAIADEDREVAAGADLRRTKQERRDALWKALFATVSKDQRKQAAVAKDALAQAAAALQAAKSKLDAHVNKRPANLADVEKWAGTKREIEDQVSIYAQMHARAQTVFEELAKAVFAELRERARQGFKDAEAAREASVREYQEAVKRAELIRDAGWFQQQAAADVYNVFCHEEGLSAVEGEL